FPGLSCGEDVADDSARTFQPAEDRRSVVADRHKTGHGPATFGDYDFNALLLDLVKQSQTSRFEGTGSYFLFHDYGHIIIVIKSNLPLYAGRVSDGVQCPSSFFTYRATCSWVANQTPDRDFIWMISFSSAAARERWPMTCGCMVSTNSPPSPYAT